MSAPLAPPNIQPIQPAPSLQQGDNLANVCRAIVLANVVEISNKNYLKVEGWESISAADKCTPEIVGVECTRVMKFGQEVWGVRAEAVLKRDSDGYIISRGFGFVGEDEYTDADSVDYYAMEAKSQTRAVSRVCRHKYAWVLSLIDKNIMTTPADEVPPSAFPSGSTTRPGRVWQPRQGAALPPPVSEGTQAQLSPNRSAQPAPATPGLWDGTIKNVDIKTGIKKSGDQAGMPYALYILRLQDGREAVTFDEKLGEQLGSAVGYQCSVSVKPAKNRRGKYIVTGLLPARNHNQTQQAPDLPPNEDDEYNE